MESLLLSTLVTNVIYKAVPLYLGVELLFYVCFHKYLVPRANRLVPPAPFRDYGNDRSRLLLRIMRRIEATGKMNQQNGNTTIHKFLAEWFHVSKNEHHKYSSTISNFPELSQTPMTSPENSDDEDSQQALISPTSVHSQTNHNNRNSDDTTLASNEPAVCLYKEDIDNFFAWAFFGKHHLTLLPWETQELDKIYQLLKQEQNMVFPQKPSCPKQQKSEAYHVSTPRCMTLEAVNAIHRPLLVYFVVVILKLFGGLVLRFMGYRRLVASTGVVGWYRPGQPAYESHLPLLFFHGIAPGGLVLYLPMLLLGLATEKERPVLLFENRSISCCMDFHPLTEKETVDGIMELVDNHLGKEQALSVVGHSFGSCPVVWLLASAMSTRIQQIVLLDPVTILLSEPDVMVNFLYAQEMNKIRMVASSELFTEYYLRRHFAWYNSEMWLEDLKEHHKLVVCLSAEDTIINAKKVWQELERHASVTEYKKPTTVYWGNSGHGDCISSPAKWTQIKGLMLQQELEIVQQQQK